GGAQTERVSTGSGPSSFTGREAAVASRAGGLCSFQPETLSWLACRTLRLLAGDSSISLRMASRSSVAEITGKRITSRQPKASRHCKDVNLRPAGAVLELRHSQ